MQIGPYLLTQRIGAGGMAEVWMAQRATLGASKVVAVKLLAANLASKPQYREMFLEEARLSMLLNNSNIVQVFDAGEDGGECYMAMEWIDGANLAELLAALWENGRQIPLEVAMYITGEVLRALDYAHNLEYGGAATIVHRDVSPANIMLSMAGEVKLMDFGVARFGTEETSGVHVKGKLRYMPPEQLRGSSREGTVDIYSVGAVLHEMVSGDKFRGSKTEEGELLGMIFAGTVPELVDPGRISAQLECLRRRMLAPEVADRVPTAREALQELRRCPGYRHAAHELEALIRWHRGLAPDDAGHRPARYVQVMPAVPSTHDSDTSVSRVANYRLATSGWVIPPFDLTAMRRRRKISAVVVAFCGLCFGCFGIGISISFAADDDEEVAASEFAPWDDWEISTSETEADEPAEPAEPTEEIAQLEPPPVAEPEPPPVAAPSEPEPEPEPELVLEEPEPEPELEPVIEEKPEPPPKPRPKVKHDPVNVKFVAGQFYFANIKVGGKRMLIEPGGTMKLSPGSHRVYVKLNDKWQSFGRITVKPDKPCTVELVKPKGLKVK